MANNLPNNPNYIQQALPMDAIKAAHWQQQEQLLNQTINTYITNLVQEQNNLAICLVHCGFDTPKMLYMLLQEGFRRLQDLKAITIKDPTEMATRIARKPNAQGPVSIGMILLKQVEVLAYWVRHCITCSDPLTPNDFTQDVLDELQAQMLAVDTRADAEDEITSKSDPGKIQTDNLKWVNWKKKLVSHLYNIRGTHSIRLIYVVQTLLLKPLSPNHQFTNEDEHLIWNAIQQGPEYQVDNTNLYQIIEQCCICTDGATWIHQASHTKDGYAALNALCQQFDSRNMKQKRKTYTEQQLRVLHYCNKKTTMKFDRFAAYLKDAFDMMEDCGIVFPEEHKVNMHFGNDTIPSTLESLGSQSDKM